MLNLQNRAVAAQRGRLGGLAPPRSQKSANIIKEKWHKISWVYLLIEKLRQYPLTIFRFFKAGAGTEIGSKRAEKISCTGCFRKKCNSLSFEILQEMIRFESI